MTPKPLNLATQAIHAGEKHNAYGSHAVPIYQTSTFTFENMAAVESYVKGEAGEAYIYGRSGNPNRTILANKLAALEGRGVDGEVSCEIFGSGMGAISAALMAASKTGDHVIAQTVLYGSTDHLILDVLPEQGISSSRVPLLDPELLKAELAKHPNTTSVFMESPANPTMSLIDIAKTAEICEAAGARLIVDNTFATPILQRPLALGAHVVVHSTTKYINGHGTILGGAVLSADSEYMASGVGAMVRFIGAVPSPFDCWLTNIGLKTLPLRMKQHCANSEKVADFLDGHSKVVATHYPGLASHPQHELASSQMDHPGAMIAFDLGSYEAATSFLDRVQLCGLAVSLGNIDTLIEHPASMTHAVVSEEDKAASGITPGLVRISVGLEDAGDIIADLDQALL